MPIQTHIMIDGDILAYRASAANEKKFDWGDGTVTVASDYSKARERVMEDIEWFRQKLEADKVTIALSDDYDNFRNRVFPRYKKHRVGDRPEQLYPIKDLLVEEFGAIRRPLLEADDLLGIWATEPDPGEIRIMVSDDKDMGTIPGLWYRHRKDAVIDTSPTEAMLFHMEQTLTGDQTDGYPGLPKVGPVKAKQVLEGLTCPAEAWDQVVACYDARGLTEADALVQARCAFILHHQYLSPDGSPVLWVPPKK